MINDVFHEMIPASKEGDALKHTQTFTTCADNQNIVEVRVLQQSSKASSLASEATLLASFELVGIPEQPAATVQIAVTFHLSENSVLTVSAVDLQTGAKQVIAIDRKKNETAFG